MVRQIDRERHRETDIKRRMAGQNDLRVCDILSQVSKLEDIN